MTEEDQRTITTGLASTLSRSALLDQAAAEIGVDQSTIGLIDGRDKRRIADPFPACELREPPVFVDASSLRAGHGQAPVYHT